MLRLKTDTQREIEVRKSAMLELQATRNETAEPVANVTKVTSTLPTITVSDHTTSPHLSTGDSDEIYASIDTIFNEKVFAATNRMNYLRILSLTSKIIMGL